MDSLNNKVAISMAVAPGVGGFQYLDLSGSPVFAFEPPFASMRHLAASEIFRKTR